MEGEESDKTISLYINICLAKSFYPGAFLSLVCFGNCMILVLQVCYNTQYIMLIFGES